MASKIGAGGKPQEYDESTGRYGDSPDYTGKGKEYRQNTPYEEIIRGTVPETAYGFADKERKNTAHHKKHAKEMGFKNQDEYERAACEFFNGKQGALYYEERRKRFYRYDERSKLLAVASDSVIHTFAIYTKKEFDRIKKQESLYEL